MGMVAFHWLDKQLNVFMNRHNWISRDISKAAWSENILGGRCIKSRGTWFGATENGRVAFLVDPSLSKISVDLSRRDPNSIPIEFLKSNKSPEMFAAQLAEEEEKFYSKLNEAGIDHKFGRTYNLIRNSLFAAQLAEEEEKLHSKLNEVRLDRKVGRTYNLVVADITSGSMVCICKSSATSPFVSRQRVASGTHTLSRRGLDYNSLMEQSLRYHLNELMCQNETQESQDLEFAQKLLYDPTEDVELLPSSQFRDDRYTITSTTIFVVNPHTKQAMFTELYLKNDKLVPKVFTFSIV